MGIKSGEIIFVLMLICILCIIITVLVELGVLTRKRNHVAYFFRGFLVAATIQTLGKLYISPRDSLAGEI